ncbi:hypothetical protein WCWAEYFT_CDS0051 [Vibrio phage VB_VaC_TDDLMA]
MSKPDKTEVYYDRCGDAVRSFVMDDDRIAIAIGICGDSNSGCVYLSKESAAEYAKQLLELCGPENQI